VVGAASHGNEENREKRKKKNKEARIHRTRLLADGSIKKGTADHSKIMENKHFVFDPIVLLKCISGYQIMQPKQRP
jgi:hypothetical protein